MKLQDMLSRHTKQLCIKKHSLLRFEPVSTSTMNGDICMYHHEGGWILHIPGVIFSRLQNNKAIKHLVTRVGMGSAE